MLIMVQQDILPAAIAKAQNSLQPFIKPRQKISQIRRVATLHLSANAGIEGQPRRPLSLIDSTCNIDGSSNGIRGLHREYLKCVRSNLKAKNEYSQLREELQVADGLDDYGNVAQNDFDKAVSCLSTDSFVDLVMKRQRHERLRILQDYIELISQKPAAGTEYLDPKVVLKDVDSLPKVPPEVMHITGSRQGIVMGDLRDLVDRLEKSVLRAKMLLYREQKLLVKVKQKHPASHVASSNHIQALASTRNELINWIETELATAADTSDATDETPGISEHDGEFYIESELTAIQRQYLRYTKARQSLILASTMDLDACRGTNENKNIPAQATTVTPQQGTNLSIISPYLESMVGISNEQKALIQQKSYLTVSLAKQLKEATQGIDRLAEESHLLPAHPIPIGQTKGPENSVNFADTIKNSEAPNSSHRALAWVHASHSARASMQQIISKKIEEGDLALNGGQESLLDLQHLLGQGTDLKIACEGSQTDSKGIEASQDIWSLLDGNLGAIKGEDI